MASWYRREIADDARLRMLLELGQVELAKAYLLATEHRVNQEDDEAPALTPEDLATLQRLGLWRSLDELITGQLANRARVRRARTKGNVTKRYVMAPNVTCRDVMDNTTDQSSSLLLSEEDQKKAPAALAKPAKATRATSIPKDWKPSATHREKAASLSLIVDSEAEQFRLSAEAKGRVYASWDAAFHTWLNNAARWRDERNTPKQAAPRPVVKGWDDGDTWLGIPKGSTR